MKNLLAKIGAALLIIGWVSFVITLAVIWALVLLSFLR